MAVHTVVTRDTAEAFDRIRGLYPNLAAATAIARALAAPHGGNVDVQPGNSYRSFQVNYTGGRAFVMPEIPPPGFKQTPRSK